MSLEGTKTIRVGEIEVPACEQRFERWPGAGRLYGGKPVIDFRGRPYFLELAIVDMLREEDWEAYWLDTFRSKREPLFIGPPAMGGIPVSSGVDFGGWRASVATSGLDGLPDGLRKTFEDIRNAVRLPTASRNIRMTGGCWDVIAARGDEVRFVESKRRDRITETQASWLQASLRLGLAVNQFLIVHWKPARATSVPRLSRAGSDLASAGLR